MWRTSWRRRVGGEGGREKTAERKGGSAESEMSGKSRAPEPRQVLQEATTKKHKCL